MQGDRFKSNSIIRLCKMEKLYAHEKDTFDPEFFLFESRPPPDYWYIPIKIAEKLLPPVNNKSIAFLCCGQGFEAEYFSKKTSNIIGLDISLRRIKSFKSRIQEKNTNIEVILANAENPPLRSDAVDFCMCYLGIHHLPHVNKSFSEMKRISREAFCVIDNRKALVTSLFIRLGKARLYETGGYPMLRLSKKEACSILSEINVLFHYFSVEQFPFMKNDFLLLAFSKCLWLVNLFFHRFGNRFIIIAFKK